MFSLITLGLFVFGAGASILGAVFWVRFLRYRIFPTAEGKIDSAQLASVMSDGRQTFTPDIRYHYEVSGARFFSDRIFSLCPFSASEKWANNFIARLQAAAQLKIYYDPENP